MLCRIGISQRWVCVVQGRCQSELGWCVCFVNGRCVSEVGGCVFLRDGVSQSWVVGCCSRYRVNKIATVFAAQINVTFSFPLMSSSLYISSETHILSSEVIKTTLHLYRQTIIVCNGL